MKAMMMMIVMLDLVVTIRGDMSRAKSLIQVAPLPEEFEIQTLDIPPTTHHREHSQEEVSPQSLVPLGVFLT